jgi:hypothetical protein
LHQLEHVPSGYASESLGRAVLWSRASSDPLPAAIVPDVIRSIEGLLDYRLRRTVHVVVYDSNEAACRALRRQVAPTMLLSPLHTRELSLVALQAPAVDPRNGDLARMRRHLCHELAHVFAAERTGSVKRLGDDNRHMRIPEWVDEGFAENVAAEVAARPDIIDEALKRSSVVTMSDDELTRAFRDLNAKYREVAYATATARIWRAVQTRSLRFVFENLAAIFSSRGT